MYVATCGRKVLLGYFFTKSSAAAILALMSGAVSMALPALASASGTLGLVLSCGPAPARAKPFSSSANEQMASACERNDRVFMFPPLSFRLDVIWENC